MAEIQSSVNVESLRGPEVIRITTEDATIHLVSRGEKAGEVFLIDSNGVRASRILGTLVDDRGAGSFEWYSVAPGGRLLVQDSGKGDEVLKGRIQRIELIIDRSLADDLRARALQATH